MEKYIQITFFPDKCLVSSFLQVSLKRVLHKVIFPVTVVKILYYDQHAFSFMTVTTIELLYYQNCFTSDATNMFLEI